MADIPVDMGRHLIRSEKVAISVSRSAGGKTVAELSSHDCRDRTIREWLLFLLRFAVTREPSDQSAALAGAEELDSVGARRRPAAPSFFLRTTDEVCEAILAASDGHSNPVLLRHVERIDDPRLKRAFQAAVGIQPRSEPQQEGAEYKRRKDQDLWKGLPKNGAGRPL